VWADVATFPEFEREIMLERQREGVAKAKADGKYKGRVPTALTPGVVALWLEGPNRHVIRPNGCEQLSLDLQPRAWVCQDFRHVPYSASE
jgi:hypothetical protein